MLNFKVSGCVRGGGQSKAGRMMSGLIVRSNIIQGRASGAHVKPHNDITGNGLKPYRNAIASQELTSNSTNKISRFSETSASSVVGWVFGGCKSIARYPLKGRAPLILHDVERLVTEFCGREQGASRCGVSTTNVLSTV